MFINIFKKQNTYSVHVEYKTYPFLSLQYNYVTWWYVQYLYLYLDTTERDITRCSSISLSDFHSYKAQPSIVFRKLFDQNATSSDCSLFEYSEINCIGKQLYKK